MYRQPMEAVEPIRPCLCAIVHSVVSAPIILDICNRMLRGGDGALDGICSCAEAEHHGQRSEMADAHD